MRPARPGEQLAVIRPQSSGCSSGSGSHCNMGESELQAALRLRPRMWRRAAGRWAPLLEHGVFPSSLKLCKLSCGCCAGCAPGWPGVHFRKDSGAVSAVTAAAQLGCQRRFFAFLQLSRLCDTAAGPWALFQHAHTPLARHLYWFGSSCRHSRACVCRPLVWRRG